MTYQQTIDYLYAQLPMFSRIGDAAIKKGLDNTIAICTALGNPQQQFKTIHIAGTNGKGSTSHMLAAILQQAGYKTGLYTSPHLKDFRERIKVNGEMVPEQYIIDFVATHQSLTEKIQPSFFELTVAMAFDYFARQQVDIAVIETGLGGRLDSTNIITPVLSVITNIGYDHMNILGDTLEQIAFEKAGIIKPHVPVVIGEYTAATKKVFEDKAASVKAPLYFVQDNITVTHTSAGLQSLGCTVQQQQHTEHYQLDLNGLYQAKNLCTVLGAVKFLQQNGFTVSSENLHQALASVKPLTGLHGRWEVMATAPAIVLDVAHNEAGIRQILEHVSATREQFAALHCITGMVKDKDVDAVLNLLPKGAAYYFTQAHIPRALASNVLQQKAAAAGLAGDVYENVNDAIAAAKANAAPDDLILVCGSVFLIGEVQY
ncbi:MAG TPA: folylpolyglutamate synthase/dihydrofolate synthase family protein [Ferruginibacter sp.]|nr:folylpolyglutamate synthase/dihydrofolate synthase family protein [Ferruginibacter sp.]HMP20897.1 folylpolyglutamate synthase/dihydrofolate synthase family protein [Ferruginibacter sp.]